MGVLAMATGAASPHTEGDSSCGGCEELKSEGEQLFKSPATTYRVSIYAAFSCKTHDPCLTWFC